MGNSNFYRRVAVESAKMLGIDNREKVVAGLVVHVAIAVVIWFALGQTALQEALPARIITSLAPFLVYPVLFIWKLATVPAAQAAEHQATLAAMQREIEALKNAPAPRHPDGVYQFGSLVGMVVNPQVNIPGGFVTFDGIAEAIDLDLNKQIEYRDMLLSIVKHNGTSEISMNGRTTSRHAHEIVAQIIERNRV